MLVSRLPDNLLEEKVGARACARLADPRMLRPLDEVQVLLAAARRAGPAADRNVRHAAGGPLAAASSVKDEQTAAKPKPKR